MNQTGERSVRKLPVGMYGLLTDSDLQLKHERTIRLICTVHLYCGCSSPTKSIMHGACSVLLYVMSTLGCNCCAFQETRLWTRETALCCVLGYCRCAKDSLVCILLDWKLRDWHWVLRSSVMICSGNEMTWMRNSLWFCKLGFCKCYIWPGVSKLFLCFIQTAYLFKYSLIANGVECFQQNRSEARTCALLLALAFTRISSLKLGGQKVIHFVSLNIHFVPCSLRSSAARRGEFKDLERSPRRETRGGL